MVTVLLLPLPDPPPHAVRPSAAAVRRVVPRTVVRRMTKLLMSVPLDVWVLPL
jgi:hypothetical protein